MHTTSAELLNFWLTMCKEILASSTNSELIRSTIFIEDLKTQTSQQNNAGNTNGDVQDEEGV